MAQKTEAPKKSAKAKSEETPSADTPSADTPSADTKATTAKATKAKATKAKTSKPKQKKPAGETFEFQAETRQLLDIVIHSLYSNKEIFLRELISNASDALDRLRFEALTEPKLDGRRRDNSRSVSMTDADARTLTISDNGIGMSRDEVITNIGTIAKSGTRELMQKLERRRKPRRTLENLIGQFGVGFYSAFMAADRVTVVTRRAGEEKATRWESTGGGDYTLGDDHRFLRGTTITLHLKPADSDNGLDDFTDFYTLQRVVKRHSDFVGYPVITKHQREETERDAEGKEIEGSSKTVVEEKTLNSMRPIWTRSGLGSDRGRVRRVLQTHLSRLERAPRHPVAAG